MTLAIHDLAFDVDAGGNDERVFDLFTCLDSNPRSAAGDEERSELVQARLELFELDTAVLVGARLLQWEVAVAIGGVSADQRDPSARHGRVVPRSQYLHEQASRSSAGVGTF